MPAREIRSVMTGVAGSPWYARHFFDSVIASTDEVARDAVEVFWEALSGRISSGVTITCEPEVTRWTNPTTVESVGSITPFTVATLGGTNPIPRASQGLIRWRTSTFNGNRRVLGKTYIPYVSEEFNEGAGVPTTAFQAEMAAAGEGLVEAGLVIASLSLNTFAEVTTASAWNQWAVLRSRRD